VSLTLTNIIAGLLLALIVAIVAWRARVLNHSGAIAAAGLGTVVFGLGGLGWAILLLAFFLSSSALSRLFRKQKRAVEEKFSKGSQRDAGQVFANGGIAGLIALIHVFLPGVAVGAWAAFAGSLAAANADTWATELGVLSRNVPRLVTNGRPVERGESGGVTLLGSLAALGGSALIALLTLLFWQGHVLSLPASAPAWLVTLVSPRAQALSAAQSWAWLGVITLAGFSGSLVDSLLGATLQANYYCPACHKQTERYPFHACGAPTRRIRGLPWLNNDGVNVVCSLVGSLAGLISLFL